MTTYTDPGAIGDVVGTSGRIEATWGNAMRDRVVNRFASTAARDAAIPSPTEGMCCYVTVTHTYYEYNGATWRARDLIDQTYAPVWTESATNITYTTEDVVYRRDAGWCSVQVGLVATSTPGAAGIRYRVTVPVTAAASVFGVVPVGTGQFFDTSTGLYTPIGVVLESSLLFSFTDQSAQYNNYAGTTGTVWALGIASGDKLYFNARYRIA